jgi:hypothetical protein
MMALLRDKKIVALTETCLHRLHKLCTARSGGSSLSPPLPLVRSNINVRVFLTAYLIAHYPTYIFEYRTGELEQALIQAATPLLATFEQICLSLQTQQAFAKVPLATALSFPTVLSEYMAAFKAWKVCVCVSRCWHALVVGMQADVCLCVVEGLSLTMRAAYIHT